MSRKAFAVKADVTLRLKQRYLEALAETGIITYAAKRAQIARQTVYDWLEADPDFAQRHAEAIVESTERMEAEAYRRAVVGIEKPVYYRGEPVGTITEHSDGLLQFMLRARKPETYRERIDVNSKVSAQIDVAPSDVIALVLEHLTDDDLSRAADALLGSGGDPDGARAGAPGEPGNQARP